MKDELRSTLVSAMEYATRAESPQEFLCAWLQGEWQTIAKEWPDYVIPECVLPGAKELCHGDEVIYLVRYRQAGKEHSTIKRFENFKTAVRQCEMMGECQRQHKYLEIELTPAIRGKNSRFKAFSPFYREYKHSDGQVHMISLGPRDDPSPGKTILYWVKALPSKFFTGYPD